jgi:hypothetical protein
MMGTNIELYEKLKPHVGDEGAKMIAEVVPAAERLATKDDVSDVRLEIAALRTDMYEFKGEIRTDMADLKGEMSELKADLRGFMLKLFVPMWVALYGTLGAVVVAIVLRVA